MPEFERRYFDALMRHWLAIQAGETLDAESGLPHWAHFAWCALALAQMGIEGGGAPGAYSCMMERDA